MSDFSYKSYAGHSGFYRFRALGSLQFSLEHSLGKAVCTEGHTNPEVNTGEEEARALDDLNSEPSVSFFSLKTANDCDPTFCSN